MGAIFAATDSVAVLQVLDPATHPALFSLVFGGRKHAQLRSQQVAQCKLPPPAAMERVHDAQTACHNPTLSHPPCTPPIECIRPAHQQRA